MGVKTEPKVYSYKDFRQMSRDVLFGFYMAVKINSLPIRCKDPNVFYASIRRSFEKAGEEAVALWLGEQKINK